MNHSDLTKQRLRFDDVKHTLRHFESFLEVVFLSIAYYFIWRTQYDNSGVDDYDKKGKYVLMLVYGLLTLFLFRYCDSFKFGHWKLLDVIVSQIISVILVNFITYFQLSLMANHMVTPVPMFMLTGIDILIAIACSTIFSVIYHRLYVPKNMLMVFGKDEAIMLKFKMDTRSDKYQIKKMISVEEGTEKICSVIPQYDAVVINDVPAQSRNDILKYCYQIGKRAYIAPKLTDIILRGSSDINLFDTPLLLIKGGGLSPMQKIIKRFLDILVSAVFLLLTLPLMLIVALAIKLEDGGPVFYKQTRITKDHKRFDILKFRSMIVDAEKQGISIPATGKDPRITKMGRITRATRIDELPQLINILKGDMSLVGPRPERVEHVDAYTEQIPEFAFRERVKGGLTGYAQIYGKYNTTPYDKLRLDLMYIENYSLILDLKLILMTLQIMLRRESTEGFEKQKEMQEKKDEIVNEMEAHQSDAEGGVENE